MTRNLRQGAVLFDVQDIVGHRTADTTAIYYRGNIDTQREVMKHDPANKEYLPPEDKLKLVIDDIRKSGILDDRSIHHEITEKSIKIEIRVAENMDSKKTACVALKDNKVGSLAVAIKY